jgi:putative DNA primase/helicase
MTNAAANAERIDFAAIAHEALSSLRAILKRILPGGRVVGREYVALNPTRADRRLGSFKICILGSRAGCWSDFATGHKGGDVISLVAYVENISQQQAAKLVARMLCVDLKGVPHG